MCELLKTRRSVRKYRPEQVPDKLLDAVLEAGLYAPSAMNNQKPSWSPSGTRPPGISFQP